MTKDISKYILKNKYKDDTPQVLKNIFTQLHRKPMLGFVLFSVVLIVIGLLSQSDLVSPAFVRAIGSTIVFCVVALGFCLLLGYSALASLGTGGFIAIGTYLAYFALTEWGLTIGMAFVVAIVAAAVIGVAVGFISLRIEGIYLAIVTLGISQIITEVMLAIKDTLNVSNKYITFAGNVNMRLTSIDVYYILVVILFILIFITHNLMNSPTGRAMLAMKNSTSAAQAFGISLMKYRLFAFVISTMYAAIAGVMYMIYIKYVSSSSSTLFTLSTSLNILGAVIIGGTKSIWGTLGGTFIIYGIDSLFLQDIEFFRKNPTLITIFCGLLVVLVVMFYPGGLVQLVREAVYKIKKLAHKAKEYRYGTEE